MQTLKQNKLLAWMLALITAFCAFIGVILPTNNVARADASFPDVSTWKEESALELTTINNLSHEDLSAFFDGKVFRFYPQELFETYGSGSLDILFYFSGEEECACLELVLPVPGEDEDWVFSDSEMGMDCQHVVRYSEEAGYYYEFMISLSDEVSYCEIECRFDEATYSCSELVDGGYLVKVVNPEGSSDIDNENKFPYFDKIANYVNENTGLAVTGSFVGTFIIGAVIYLLIKKK